MFAFPWTPALRSDEHDNRALHRHGPGHRERVVEGCGLSRRMRVLSGAMAGPVETTALPSDERFTFEASVGRGAFGEVFRAIDHHTGATVAVKRLISGGLDPIAAARFAHECEALARVKHPNVVGYVAHGRDASGTPWLALEWLLGEDLHQRQRRSPLSRSEAREVILGAARGLHALHTAGIIHRDVKPSNLFLTSDAAGVITTRVIDLGIARSAEGARLTLAGFRVGTPDYMSPEQVRADGETTLVTDVYSLGVVLFELITRRRLFSGDAFAVMAKIVLQTPPLLRNAASDVPPELEALVECAMARDAARRFPTAAALAEALAAVPIFAPRVGDDAPTAPIEIDIQTAAVGHRVVTALFAAFELASLATGCETVFASIVTRNGGVVHRMPGGRAISVFGLQRTQGDEAVRAARAALEAAAALAGIRLAVATSRAVARVAGLSGEVIERGAACLERAHGFIAIDDATARLIETHFPVEGVDGARVLARVGPHDVTDAAPKLLGRETPTVGRERELAWLLGIFDQCAHESSPCAAVVIAPAGAGKSRVRREFAIRLRRHDPSAEIWTARGDPMRGGTAYGLIAHALRGAMALYDGEPLSHWHAKIEARVALHVKQVEAQRVAEFLGEILGAPFLDAGSAQLRSARHDPALMGEQTRRAFEDWLAAECAAHPCVIILEDLHWGDLSTVKLLDDVLRNLFNAPVMVVAFARPELREVFPHLWVGHAVSTTELVELSRKSAEALVRGAVGDNADTATTARLVDRAAGNPFFLEELIRAVVGRHESTLPDSVVAIVQAGIDALDTEAQRFLRVAAVFGRVFWRAGVIAAMGGELVSRAAADAAIATLVQAEMIIEPSRSRFPDETEFVFRHALVREVAYAMSSAVELRGAHGAAALWLESAGDTDAGGLAEHFERGAMPDQAIRWFVRAGKRAINGSDLRAAQSHCERGLVAARRVANRDDAVGEFLAMQAEVLRGLGEFAPAATTAMEAMRLLPRASAGWYAAASRAAAACGRLGRFDDSERMAREITSHSPTPATVAPRLAVLCSVASQLYLASRLEAAGAIHEIIGRESVHLAADDWGAYAHIHEVNSRRKIIDHDLVGALAESRVAIDLYERAGDSSRSSLARVNAGYGYLSLGAFELAEVELRAALASANRLGLPLLASGARHNLGFARGLMGHTAEAAVLERQCLDWYRGKGDARMSAACGIYLARIQAMAGDHGEALATATLAVESAVNTKGMLAIALAVVAEEQLALARPSEALVAASRAFELLQQSAYMIEGGLEIRAALIASLDGNGRREQAVAALRDAWPLLLQDAAHISDEPLREGFLTRLPHNARLCTWARDWLARSYA